MQRANGGPEPTVTGNRSIWVLQGMQRIIYLDPEPTLSLGRAFIGPFLEGCSGLTLDLSPLSQLIGQTSFLRSQLEANTLDLNFVLRLR
jgi:hypothetical protein